MMREPFHAPTGKIRHNHMRPQVQFRLDDEYPAARASTTAFLKWTDKLSSKR